MEKLKLCPFCACHDRRVGVRKMGKAGYKVICSKCGSSGPYVRIADFPNKMGAQEEAKRAWNKRGTMKVLIDIPEEKNSSKMPETAVDFIRRRFMTRQ